MAVIQGKNLIIKIGGKVIAGAKSCSIDVKGEQIEIASPSQGLWSEFIAGRKSWSASCSHLIPANSSAIKSRVAMVNTLVTITVVSGQSGDTLTGNAFVEEWNVTGTVGSLAQGSFKFKGTGALS